MTFIGENMYSIDDYIKSSRVEKKISKEILKYYLSKIELISKMVSSVENEYPEIKTCCSLNQKCERIHFFNKDYLLIDIYYIILLNILTTMFYIPQTNEIDVVRFICKHDAELYYCSGQQVNAALHGICFEQTLYKCQNNSKEKVNLTPTVALAISTDVAIQVLFIIFHEIYHWKLSQLQDDEKRQLITKKRNHIITNKPLNLLPKVVNNCLINYSDDDLRWISTDSNIEELLCDEYAFRQVLRVQNIIESKWMNNVFHLNDFHNSLNTVVESCILCLDNMKTLCIPQWDVKYASEELLSNPGAKINYPQGIYEDSEYRFNYFVFDTIINNNDITGNESEYLEHILRLSSIYRERIFLNAYTKNIFSLLSNEELLYISYLSMEDSNSILNRIPNW